MRRKKKDSIVNRYEWHVFRHFTFSYFSLKWKRVDVWLYNETLDFVVAYFIFVFYYLFLIRSTFQTFCSDFQYQGVYLHAQFQELFSPFQSMRFRRNSYSAFVVGFGLFLIFDFWYQLNIPQNLKWLRFLFCFYTNYAELHNCKIQSPGNVSAVRSPFIRFRRNIELFCIFQIEWMQIDILIFHLPPLVTIFGYYLNDRIGLDIDQNITKSWIRNVVIKSKMIGR